MRFAFCEMDFFTYHTPDPYFCDRKNETEDLVRFLENGLNRILIPLVGTSITENSYGLNKQPSVRKGRRLLFFI